MFDRSCILICCGLIAACNQPAEESASESRAAPPAAQEGVPAALPRQPSPPGARVYIISPADGAVVSNPVRIVFGLSGMGVAPAGTERENTGHHHLLIDAEVPDLNLPIPADDQYVHFGGGQTETERTLTPGRHTLRLLLGDHLHIPHDPPLLSEPVTIQVQ